MTACICEIRDKKKLSSCLFTFLGGEVGEENRKNANNNKDAFNTFPRVIVVAFVVVFCVYCFCFSLLLFFICCCFFYCIF